MEDPNRSVRTDRFGGSTSVYTNSTMDGRQEVRQTLLRLNQSCTAALNLSDSRQLIPSASLEGKVILTELM